MILKDGRKKAEPFRFHLLKFSYTVFVPQERIQVRGEKCTLRE